MEENLEARLVAMEKKIDTMYASVEKLRKYFLWTGIITVAVIVIPLLLIPFLIPAFLTAEGLGSLQGL